MICINKIKLSCSNKKYEDAMENFCIVRKNIEPQSFPAERCREVPQQGLHLLALEHQSNHVCSSLMEAL
jgi:hypothetical protein